MAKKKKIKKSKPLNKENAKEIMHLESLLKHTLLAIDGKSEKLDELFQNQANNIKARIKKIKG